MNSDQFTLFLYLIVTAETVFLGYSIKLLYDSIKKYLASKG